MNTYHVVIIGSGAAGLGAAVYAGRYRLKTLVIGEEFGGETARAGKIENWPGSIEIDGYDLMSNMKKHAEATGAEFLDGEVTKVEKAGDCIDITVGDQKLRTNTLVLGVGSDRRRLGLPNEEKFTGKGVHFCVTCDGPVYTDKTIAVVGGGDASVKGINLASQYVKKVYLIVRADKLRAEPINVEQMKKLGDKVEILFETEVKEIVGDEKFQKIILSKEYNGSKELDIDGLFIDIGANPNVGLAKSLGAELDEFGYIKVDNMMKTTAPAVFAAGDVTNHFGHFKQDITAAAMGSVAATSAYEYIKVHGEVCPVHHVPAQAGGPAAVKK